jgi:hypothetical protein
MKKRRDGVDRQKKGRRSGRAKEKKKARMVFWFWNWDEEGMRVGVSVMME